MLSLAEVLVSLLSALTCSTISTAQPHPFGIDTHNALAVASKTLLPLALALLLVPQLLLLQLLGLVRTTLGVWTRVSSCSG